MYRNWGRVIAEWSHSGELNRDNIENFITYDGTYNLTQALALAEKRGAIILTAHYGNFELLPLAHSIYGHRLAMVKYLHRKWQVAVALDLDVRKGVFADFFGMKASTSEGVARIAMATRAPVVPAFMVREGDTAHHRITVLPVVEMVVTRDHEECVRENTQRMTTAIEMMIRRHPDHWNWIHRRWKTRPAGEKRFY